MHTISTIRVSGADAAEFLQGQLTNDIRRLETEQEMFAAWCTPKGRVIWFGTVWPTEAGFGMSVPAEMAEDIVRRLKMFRFRSKVEFEIVDEGVTVDPASLVDNGYPYIGPEQSEQFTPHMLNLDLLDAISYDKGCYTGQEIVARTHYKGTTKRRTMKFEINGQASPGDKVSDGDRDVGEVLNVAGNHLLAVVPVDRRDADLTVADASLVHVALPYQE